MSVQSISNTLTAQQILQLLQQQQLAGSDPNATTGATTETAGASGQNLPTGANSADTAAGGTAVSTPKALDPATIKALLQIQESQSMAAVESQFFGAFGSSPGSNAGSIPGSTTGSSTGNPFLDALNGTSSQTSTGDPLLDALAGNANDPLANNPLFGTSSSNNSLDALLAQLSTPSTGTATGTGTGSTTLDPTALQAMISSFTGSASSTSSLTGINQSMLDFLNSFAPAQSTTANPNTQGPSNTGIGTVG